MQKAKDPYAPKLVIVESPYAGRDDASVARNVKYGRACMAHSLSLGEAPFASHLLYTQDGVLDDRIPEQRAQGIGAGFAWGQHAELRAFYTDLGVSEGMRLAEKKARETGQRIERRSLYATDWDSVVSEIVTSKAEEMEASDE